MIKHNNWARTERKQGTAERIINSEQKNTEKQGKSREREEQEKLQIPLENTENQSRTEQKKEKLKQEKVKE